MTEEQANPKQVIIRDAKFVFGAHHLGDLPLDGYPEIAFIGRSNVGKSSFLNRTLKRKALARTSSTPGHTQQLNFFLVDIKQGGDEPKKMHFVDLPGYGYAKFSKARREVMSALIVDYIREREELKLVCLLNDCRRMPEQEELALRELAFDSGKHILVVLTKIDKLKANERKKQKDKIAKAYGLEPGDMLITGEKGAGQPLWPRLMPLIDEDSSV